MELNRKMVIAEFQSLIHIAKATGDEFITSPFRREFLEYAIDLINKLTEECNSYRDTAEYQQTANMNRAFELKRLTEENERLKTEHYRTIEEHEAELYAIKAETVRKIQETIAENYAVSEVPYVEGEQTITYQLTNWALKTIAKKIMEDEI